MNKLKMFSIFIFVLAVSFSGRAQDDSMTEKSNEPKGSVEADGTLYGSSIAAEKEIITVDDLVKNTEAYDGKVVLVRGKVSDVCQKAGCWMTFSSGTTNIRVKTNHDFFLPKDITGKSAMVIGRFKVVQLSEEMAKHYNEESANPNEEVKGPVLSLEIEANGIKILNEETGSVIRTERSYSVNQ